jgi:hypothetical protein
MCHLLQQVTQNFSHRVFIYLFISLDCQKNGGNFLNSINQPFFVTRKGFASFAVRAEFLSIIHMSF